MKKPAQIFHFDLYGKREDKYNFLDENTVASIDWKELKPQEPVLFFVPKDFETKKEYDKGFSVTELFKVTNVGIVTSRDAYVIDDSKEELEKRMNDFFILTKDELQKRYGLKENQSWKIEEVKSKVKNFNKENVLPVSYRPFDNKYLYYDDNFIERSRKDVMQHFLKGENVGITLCKQFKSGETYQHVLISNKIIESSFVSNKTSEITSIFPLYLYPDNSSTLLEEEKTERVPNFNMEIVEKISKCLQLELDSTNNSPFGGGQRGRTFTPTDLLDYIYAVLHSPTYREKYKEFLKIDFPRVPYPKDKETFWKLVKLGGELRQIHLLESPVVENYITQYPEDGDNVVEKPRYAPPLEGDSGGGRVYINETQYFANVPEVAWNFYIGGYQPAQKWLKDRKDRTLEFEDILHYQRIIVALTETNRLMKEVDKFEIE